MIGPVLQFSAPSLTSETSIFLVLITEASANCTSETIIEKISNIGFIFSSISDYTDTETVCQYIGIKL